MKISPKVFNYSSIVIGILATVITAINLEIIYAVVCAVIWALAILSVYRFHLVTKYALVMFSIVTGITLGLNILIPIFKTQEVVEAPTQYLADDTKYPSNTIYVEAETGVLSNPGSYSFLGTTSRGGEAYLGNGNAAVTYTFTANVSGNYMFAVRLSDDNLHDDDTRSVDILIDNIQAFKYNHISEDTKGWKWFEIAKVYLNEGEHVVTFTKTKTTSAAYSMDAFRFIPE